MLPDGLAVGASGLIGREPPLRVVSGNVSRDKGEGADIAEAEVVAGDWLPADFEHAGRPLKALELVCTLVAEAVVRARDGVALGIGDEDLRRWPCPSPARPG